MKGHLNSEFGNIFVDADVIATYAGSVAVSCFGVVGMSAYNMRDGLFHILKKDSLKYGINVKIDENRIYLTIHCINLVEAVKYKVEQFTGLPVEKVDVLVEGVRVID